MNYDIVIIGSGPGGYVAAIRCAQLGMKTALIEKYNTLGGTCLNVGCIPSKALLDSSEHFHNAVHNFDTHGIILEKSPKADIKKMIARKDDVVSQTCKGVEFLMKKNKIDVYHGLGSFENNKVVKVSYQDGKETRLEGKYFIIATGSKPITPPVFNYDKERIITSTEALNLQEIPKKMIIIGAGVIGLELGSVYARLGTKVEVVEFMDRALANMDIDCGKELVKSLKKLNIDFHFGHQVNSVERTSNGVLLKMSKKNTDTIIELEADYCLVAIGRRPYTSGLGLENTSVQIDEKGRILVNEHLQTTESHIYAIGDVVRGAMLAHKAEEEGIFVAELLAGQKPHLDYNLIPGVVYTWPEVASVGKTEDELKTAGIPYKVGKFPFKALGRSRASMDTEGLIKVLAHKDTDELLGVHMVGPRVADVIMEAVALMEFRASAEDMARICHPHPTYTEAVKEAALAATDNRALHI